MKQSMLLCAGAIAVWALGASAWEPPLAPGGIVAHARQWRIDIAWSWAGESNWQVQRSTAPEGPWELIRPCLAVPLCSDFVGRGGVEHYYRVRRIDMPARGEAKVLSQWTVPVRGISAARDESRLLGEIQEAYIRFFTLGAHAESGMANEWYSPYWSVKRMPRVAASGASGMGMVNLVVGMERGFIAREGAREQALRMVRFLDQKAEKFHGAFSHWIHPQTGKATPFSEFDDGADLVETAFVAQGLLCLRQAFQGEDPVEVEIRTTADRLWRGIEWDWFLRADGKTLNWHWSPNHGWKKNMPIRGFNEAAIVYLLAAASPTHGIPADAYVEGWRNNRRYVNERVVEGVPLVLGREHGGPLFFTHYSYMGFDPRRLAVGGRSYFDQFRRFCLVQQQYMRSRANTYKGYDRLWGLTAAFGPDGYSAFEPGKKDNGTIAPTAALSSMPYAPREAMACLHTMYYDYGHQLWQEFGFVDSFNMSRDWVAPRYLGIDSGPVAPMIENFRSGRLWKLFMEAPEIQRLLQELKAVDPQLVLPPEG